MKEYKVLIDDDGDIYWYKPGTCVLHREGGPAIEYANGDKAWYKEGKRNRDDGPAVEANGYKAWYLDGIQYTEEEFFKKTSKAKSDSCDGKIVEIEGKKYKLQKL